jgi:hypothetical protein
MRPPPHTSLPSDGKGPPWREMPTSGDFPNTSSRVPIEGAHPEAPSTKPVQREMLHSQSPLHPALKVPGRWAHLWVPQTGPLWKEMPVSMCLGKWPNKQLMSPQVVCSIPQNLFSHSWRDRSSGAAVDFLHIPNLATVSLIAKFWFKIV